MIRFEFKLEWDISKFIDEVSYYYYKYAGKWQMAGDLKVSKSWFINTDCWLLIRKSYVCLCLGLGQSKWLKLWGLKIRDKDKGGKGKKKGSKIKVQISIKYK